MEGHYLRKHIGLMERFLLLLIFTFVIGHYVFGVNVTRICGTSMASTFNDGDYVFVTAVRDGASLQRGDIITFYPDCANDVLYIKRVIGLPGETIEAVSNSVFVDGEEVSFWHGTGTWGPITIPEDAVFVLGDNRAVSNDSRLFGCVPFKQICSKILGDCRRK